MSWTMRTLTTAAVSVAVDKNVYSPGSIFMMYER
jgi:hypothetical protein